MKNAVIAVLSLALLFFVLQSLGTFDFGTGIDHGHRSWFVEKRTRAVNASGVWVFGTSLVEGDRLRADTLRGMQAAINVLNWQGPVLGKTFSLEVRSLGPDPQSRKVAVQAFCDRMETAVFLGPSESASVPSVRSLTQFQGLPCVSPLVPPDPHWPNLAPDNLVALLPPLAQWVEGIGLDLVAKGHDKILIVGPEEGSYGWYFANACEQDIHTRLPGAEVFRLNYAGVPILEEIRHTLLLYNENRGLDALVYTGNMQGLEVCRDALSQLQLRIPVYGSDTLDEAGLQEALGAMPFPVFVPRCELKQPGELFPDLWPAPVRGGEGEKVGVIGAEHLSNWATLGACSVLLTARALRELGAYEPDRLVEKMREILARQREAQPTRIRLVEVGKGPVD